MPDLRRYGCPGLGGGWIACLVVRGERLAKLAVVECGQFFESQEHGFVWLEASSNAVPQRPLRGEKFDADGFRPLGIVALLPCPCIWQRIPRHTCANPPVFFTNPQSSQTTELLSSESPPRQLQGTPGATPPSPFRSFAGGGRRFRFCRDIVPHRSPHRPSLRSHCQSIRALLFAGFELALAPPLKPPPPF